MDTPNKIQIKDRGGAPIINAEIAIPYSDIRYSDISISYEIDSLNNSAASCNGLIALCTYNFDVIALEECPKALLMTSMPTPCAYISVAAVCRAS